MGGYIEKFSNYLGIVVVVYVIGYITYKLIKRWNATTYVNYKDGNTYGINTMKSSNKSLKELKLKRFSDVSKRLEKIVLYCCTNNYPDEHRAFRLYKRWAKSMLKETSPDEEAIAYVINKGKEFRVCITDKKTGELENINTTMFVCVHELAHLMSASYGHTDTFWENNRILLKVAGELKVYDHVQYEKNNDMYCGENIYSNPCSDASCGIAHTDYTTNTTGICAERLKNFKD